MNLEEAKKKMKQLEKEVEETKKKRKQLEKKMEIIEVDVEKEIKGKMKKVKKKIRPNDPLFLPKSDKIKIRKLNEGKFLALEAPKKKKEKKEQEEQQEEKQVDEVIIKKKKKVKKENPDGKKAMKLAKLNMEINELLEKEKQILKEIPFGQKFDAPKMKKRYGAFDNYLQFYENRLNIDVSDSSKDNIDESIQNGKDLMEIIKDKIKQFKSKKKKMEEDPKEMKMKLKEDKIKKDRLYDGLKEVKNKVNLVGISRFNKNDLVTMYGKIGYVYEGKDTFRQNPDKNSKNFPRTLTI